MKTTKVYTRSFDDTNEVLVLLGDTREAADKAACKVIAAHLHLIRKDFEVEYCSIRQKIEAGDYATAIKKFHDLQNKNNMPLDMYLTNRETLEVQTVDSINIVFKKEGQ